MIELEKKILLTKTEYDTLFAALSQQGKTSTQINHYYDTADLSGDKNGITYRIREKGTQFQATIKKHRWQSVDSNHEISGAVKDAHDTSFFQNPALIYQGTLTTHRLRIQPYEGLEIVLDKNIYLGHCDYELEIEYVKDFEDQTLVYLDELEKLVDKYTYAPLIERINMEASKSSRFFFRKSHFATEAQSDI